MKESSLYRLTKADIPKAVECLKDAFSDDPLWTEVFWNTPRRDRAVTNFFTCPLLYGMKYGGAYADSSEIGGVAVWMPDTHADMTIWRMLCCKALLYGAKIGKESADKLKIISKQLVPDRVRLMKEKRYAYLMIIGVSSAKQREGLGSKLMDGMKKECAARGQHIYLETQKENNLTFYEKHGFVLLQKTVINKLNLPMWQMEWQP